MESIQKKYGVFISYSHEDSEYVSPIVSLISSMRSDLVFQDTKNLKPGTKWEPQLEKALDEATIIILFWCKHAAKSAYIRKEYERAIKNNTDILPVLLDDSKLHRKLAAYQWIDFQKIISHDKKDFRKRSFGWVFILGFCFLVGIVLMNLKTCSRPSDPQSLPASPGTLWQIFKYIVLIGIALPILVLIKNLIFTRPNVKRFKRSDSYDKNHALDQSTIANEIRDKLNEKLPPGYAN